MQKQIKSALISVFHKDGLDEIIHELDKLGVKIYSTGGTQKFIEKLGVACQSVESVTDYPGILGGRVKTLHPKIFGGILARRDYEADQEDARKFEIPEIDLVIVDLYPFEETVKNTSEEADIIEKIDIGGVSLIRAAGKNYKDVMTVSSKNDYPGLLKILKENKGVTTLEDRKQYAAVGFELCAHYDVAIARYFTRDREKNYFVASATPANVLRYGENPHQKGAFYGRFDDVFEQIHGKAISYNNLVDIDGAVRLVQEFSDERNVFAVIKHTNPCGLAIRPTLKEAWEAALAGDSQSAFGGVLVTNEVVDAATAEEINKIFFEILVAKDFEPTALKILEQKKNRILLKQIAPISDKTIYKNVANGILEQDVDEGNYDKWEEVGARETTEREKEDLKFANIVCKHLKSNAIALIKDRHILGRGSGQTSRIDALKQAIEKAQQFNHTLKGAVMSSDAFFPFDDCVKLAHEEGITAIIQPGGSIRDQDSIDFCKKNGIAMVLTGKRHFKH